MTYKLVYDGSVIHPEGFSFSQRNRREWRKYQEWLDQGNTPDPADPAPVNHNELWVQEARQWFQDNPGARQIFQMTTAQIEAEISSHVDAILPLASAPLRNKEKTIRTLQLISLRLFAKQLGFID